MKLSYIHDDQEGFLRKLIIHIPCYNEENSLPITFEALPKTVKGFDLLEVMVVDDGSTDKTLEVAKQLGVNHIISLPHQGLAKTYLTGMRAAYNQGADTVVNVDADNQYVANDINKLVAPILAREAQCVIGERPITSITPFPLYKKILITAGSWLISYITGIKILDAPSGFRALQRDAIPLLTIHSHYSYTIEMLICFAAKKVPIRTVAIHVNPTILRPSRLIRSNLQYTLQSFRIITTSFARYHRNRFIATLAVITASACGLWYVI